MKVISLLQPWATLVVIGAKKIETRSWNTKYRGPLLIHASKKFSDDFKEIASNTPFKEVLVAAGYLKIRGYEYCFSLPTSAIIGQVNLYGTEKTDFFEKAMAAGLYGPNHEQELAFGDYGPNRYGWLLSDPVKFDQTIPAKGQLGLWEFNEALIK